MGWPWYAEAALGLPGAVLYVWLVFASARLEKRLGVYTPLVTFGVLLGVPVAGFWLVPWAAGVATMLGIGFLGWLTYLYARPHR